MEINDNRPYPLPQVLSIMKPHSIDSNKDQEIVKLEKALDDSSYIAEEKIDGNHYTTIENRFFSTHLSAKDEMPVEKTSRLAHLHEILNFVNLPNIILDGEVNYPDQKTAEVTSITGSSPSEAIAKQQQRGWLHYTVYDVLRDENGNWLVNKPWRERREYLEYLGYVKLNRLSKYIHLNPVIYQEKRAFLQDLLDQGKEGIVLKHVNGLYILGKRPKWNQIKIKAEFDDDVVIMGFDPPERIYTGKCGSNWQYWEGDTPVTRYHASGWIGSIAFGKYVGDQLIRLGTCSGIDESIRAKMSIEPEHYVGQVMKIKAMEKTKEGAYRHARFISLHPDKNSFECTL